MAAIAEQHVREIIPDAHPHVLLHYLGAPADELSARDATAKLHLIIAGASDSQLHKAADTLAAFLNQPELSHTCFNEMVTIRANERHIAA